MDKVRAAAIRFWGWPWKFKGPVIGVVAFFLLGGILSATGSGDDKDVSTAKADEDAPAATAAAKDTNTAKPTDEPKATATAKPTDVPKATNTPKPTNTPDPSAAEAAYRAQILAAVDPVSKGFNAMSTLMSAPQATQAWLDQFTTASAGLVANLNALKAVTPPERYKSWDAEYDAALDAEIAAVTEVTKAIQSADVNGLTAANTKLTTAVQAVAAVQAKFASQ